MIKIINSLLFIVIIWGGVTPCFARHELVTSLIPLNFSITMSIAHSWDPCPRDFALATVVIPNDLPYSISLNNGVWKASAKGGSNFPLLNNGHWNYGVNLGENTWDITIKGRTIRRKFYYNSSPCYWYPDTTETISYP